MHTKILIWLGSLPPLFYSGVSSFTNWTASGRSTHFFLLSPPESEERERERAVYQSQNNTLQSFNLCEHIFARKHENACSTPTSSWKLGIDEGDSVSLSRPLSCFLFTLLGPFLPAHPINPPSGIFPLCFTVLFRAPSRESNFMK